MSTEEGMLHVTGLVAPLGEVVTAQLRSTAPVNPPAGVTLIVEVLPVVAPWVTTMFPLFDSERPGGTGTDPLTSAVMARVWMNSPVAASLPVTSTL
jgi:hypothetical protein